MHTAYMFQMYVNNWNFSEEEFLVHEVMLAEKDLRNDFIDERKVPDAPIIKATLKKAIDLQDNCLKATIRSGQDAKLINIMKLDFMRDFQARLIELTKKVGITPTPSLAPSSVIRHGLFADAKRLAPTATPLANVTSKLVVSSHDAGRKCVIM